MNRYGLNLLLVGVFCNLALLAQTITCEPADLIMCSDDSLVVNYTVSSSMNPGNIFQCWLSDSIGSFVSPTLIGLQAGMNSDSLSIAFPTTISGGNGYRLRVNASDPPVVGVQSTDSLLITVAPNAGFSVSLDICDNADTLDLNMLLNADSTGVWFGPDSLPHSGVFVPGVDLPGCYTYHVSGNFPCSDASSQVCINVSIFPDPGINSVATVCINDSPFSLLDSLDGTPNANGFWFDTDSLVHSNIFIPGVSTSGCYTYYVSGNFPCPDATSTLCITVDSCLVTALPSIIDQNASLQIITGWNTDQPTLSLGSFTGAGVVQVMSLEGKVISTYAIKTGAGEHRLRLDLSAYAAGKYEVVLSAGGVRSYLSIVKTK